MSFCIRLRSQFKCGEFEREVKIKRSINRHKKMPQNFAKGAPKLVLIVAQVVGVLEALIPQPDD